MAFESGLEGVRAQARWIPLQIVRGAAFGLTMLLLVRRTRTDRLMAGLDWRAAAERAGRRCAAPAAHAYLPDVVRLAHLAEVAVSNFVFGLLAAWWLWPQEGQQAR